MSCHKQFTVFFFFGGGETKRQKHLNALILMDFEDWAIPYIIKICDEYVVKIVAMTYEILKEKDTTSIRRFVCSIV